MGCGPSRIFVATPAGTMFDKKSHERVQSLPCLWIRELGPGEADGPRSAGASRKPGHVELRGEAEPRNRPRVARRRSSGPPPAPTPLLSHQP